MDTTSLYINLITDFLDNKLSGSEFESAFIKQRRSDLIKNNEYNDNLEDLFFDVDSFCSDVQLTDPDDITEEQLRKKCLYMLESLVQR